MRLDDSLRDGLDALGLVIPAGRQAALLIYLEELQRWSKHINLTAIRDPAAGVEKHLLDALTLMPLLQGDERLIDLGSGAGLPGIPLKIAMPGLELVSVDAVEKKVLFQRHVLRKLQLQACVEHTRIEALPASDGYRNGFEVVTARAFSSLELLTELAQPLLRAGGRLLAMKGPEGEREWRAAEPHCPGWRCCRLQHVTLPFSSAQRQLLVLEYREGDH